MPYWLVLRIKGVKYWRLVTNSQTLAALFLHHFHQSIVQSAAFFLLAKSRLKISQVSQCQVVRKHGIIAIQFRSDSMYHCFCSQRVTSTSESRNLEVSPMQKTLSLSSFRLSYLLRNLMMVIFPSRQASCLPMHALGPPLKFISVITCISVVLQRSSSHLSGLNSRGSSKLALSNMAILQLQLRAVPLATGMSPTIMFWDAYRSKITRAGDLCLRDSFQTRFRYSIFLMLSPVMSASLLMLLSISSLSLLRTLGCQKSINMAETNRLEVVSSPATTKMQTSSQRSCSRLGSPCSYCTMCSMIVLGLQVSLLAFFSLNSLTYFSMYLYSTFLVAFLRCISRLQSALNLISTAFDPSITTIGLQASLVVRSFNSPRAWFRGSPSIRSQLESMPRNKLITTLPKMLRPMSCRLK